MSWVAIICVSPGPDSSPCFFFYNFLCYQEIAVCSDRCTIVRYSSQIIDCVHSLRLVIEDAETFPHANSIEYAEISQERQVVG